MFVVEKPRERLDRFPRAIAQLIGADTHVMVASTQLLTRAPSHNLTPEAVMQLVASLRTKPPHVIRRKHEDASLTLHLRDDERVTRLLRTHLLEPLERRFRIIFDRGCNSLGLRGQLTDLAVFATRLRIRQNIGTRLHTLDRQTPMEIRNILPDLFVLST